MPGDAERQEEVDGQPLSDLASAPPFFLCRFSCCCCRRLLSLLLLLLSLQELEGAFMIAFEFAGDAVEWCLMLQEVMLEVRAVCWAAGGVWRSRVENGGSFH